MTWKDCGNIFEVNNLSTWAYSHAYVPTAIKLQDRIRVFVAFWDDKRHGRLGYIDVDPIDPIKILGYSKKPIVVDSIFPAFDCSGITPLCSISEDDHIKLYYAGWSLHDNPNIRYRLFTGLLLGDKSANTFSRYEKNPIIKARHPQEYVRTGGQVIKTAKGYRCYLATQKGSHNIFGKSLPIYDLECAFSDDGYNWTDKQVSVFRHKEKQILGFGRSAIWINNNIYEGLFSVRNWNGTYSDLLYSSSRNGLDWEDLQKGKKAFLASMTCDQQKAISFPSLIIQDNTIIMFYSGNDFGKDGLRLAIWR